ncbi:MAG: family 2A encapsulin nanocompartment cargo protein cysteine desulfurase [Candidatus Acidiferrales bacterium]
MTPSEPGAPGPERENVWSEVWLSGQDFPPGVPDPAVLARLANEFFTALPDFTQASSAVLAGPAQLPSVPASAEPQMNPQGKVGIAPPDPFPSEAELRALPETLARFPAPSPPVPGEILRTPATIPGDFGTIRFSDLPSFSFLQEARPIFADAPAALSSPALSAVITRDFPGGGPGAATPTVPEIGDIAGTKHFGAPLVPGASVRPEAAERSSAYGFLSEARQLVPVDVSPIVEPASSQAAVAPDLGLSSRSFEVGEIRRDFPILQERVNGRPLIWLDNAATTQKPQSVIDRLNDFYAHENSNIHRAAHELAARATDAYEAAREKVRRFLNASTVREIIFVRGATEGINLVAQSWGRQNIQRGDEIVITWLEHHANIVPWQMLCAEKGARLRVAPVDDTGQILLDEYTKLVGARTRLVSLPQVSNALGTITPTQEMIEIAHRHGAKVLLDGAQSVSHLAVDVQLLDCDFFVFSGHKIFGPTGIGAVYGKLDILEQTQPWQGGGSMIQDVTFEKTVYNTPPARFEAGTGNIADAVGLGAALDYVQRIGLANIARYEHDLLIYATEGLRSIPGLRLIGTAKEKASVLSFVLDGFRTEDIGAALNREGIAVRAGHHCAQPILRRFGLETTVRASLALYNTCEEVDALVAALWNLKQGRHSSLL